MTAMKRIFWPAVALAALGLTAAWLAGRGLPAKKADRRDGRIQVVVSLPLLRDLVEAVGGAEVTVYNIVKSAACTHAFEPAMGDMRRVAAGSLFVRVGQGFDPWVDGLLRSAGNRRLEVVDASRGVAVLRGEDAHEEDPPGESGVDTGVNPHYWGNPANVGIVLRNILAGLAKVRPAKEGYFAANRGRYLKELDRTLAELRTEVASLSTRRLVSYSAAFLYLYAYFGFTNLATVEEACEQEVAPSRLAAIATLMQRQGVKVLVGEAVYPTLPAILARETGAEVVLLWPATDEHGKYLETLRDNVMKLVSALR